RRRPSQARHPLARRRRGPSAASRQRSSVRPKAARASPLSSNSGSGPELRGASLRDESKKALKSSGALLGGGVRGATGDRAHLARCGPPDGECGDEADHEGEPEARTVAAGRVVKRAHNPGAGGAAEDRGEHERAEDGAIVLALENLGGNGA